MRELTKPAVLQDNVLFQIRKSCIHGLDRLLLMYVIYCERREMRTLSDESLQDIGIDREQLRREYSRKLSDIPENRIGGSRDWK